MLTKMRNKLHTPWSQGNLPSIAKLPKLLSGAELTRSSWATRIESYADVPDIYKNFFEPSFLSGREFPYTVLTPTHERFIRRQTEKLISIFDSEIYILEKSGDTFETHCFPLGGISYIEFRTALLASSFKICGMTGQEVQSSITLIFNSVTDYLFKPILKRTRPTTPAIENNVRNPESEKFDHLADINFKFMNLAKHSLLGGEKVLQFILQPEIRESVLRESALTLLTKTFFKTISPTHMLILTDRELIAIQEEMIPGAQNRYGGIWDYIPLIKILSLSVSERTDDLLVITVQLPEDTNFEILFQASAREELNQLLERSNEFIGK